MVSMVPRRSRGKIFGVIAAAAFALALPATTLAAGPGNNGLDPTGNGTKSNATVGTSLSAAGSSATMNNDQGGSSGYVGSTLKS